MLEYFLALCRCSPMAEHELPKLDTRVRFPSPAPIKKTIRSFFCRWQILFASRRRGDRTGGNKKCERLQAFFHPGMKAKGKNEEREKNKEHFAA